MLEQLQNTVNQMVDPPESGNISTLFSDSWLMEHKWIAVPAERGTPFFENQEVDLLHAWRAFDVAEFLTIIPPGKSIQIIHSLPTNDDGLLQLSRRYSVESCLLTTRDVLFAIIISISHDYLIYAGPEEFVKIACGGDINAARTAYDYYIKFFGQDFFKNADGKYSQYDRYKAMADRYRELGQ